MTGAIRISKAVVKVRAREADRGCVCGKEQGAPPSDQRVEMNYTTDVHQLTMGSSFTFAFEPVPGPLLVGPESTVAATLAPASGQMIESIPFARHHSTASAKTIRLDGDSTAPMTSDDRPSDACRIPQKMDFGSMPFSSKI